MLPSKEKSAIYDMIKDFRKNARFKARFPSHILHTLNQRFLADDSIQDVRINELFERVFYSHIFSSKQTFSVNEIIKDQMTNE